MQPRYRFLNEKGEHRHELWKDDSWHPLVGTSSVMQVVSRPLTYWASGLAVQAFGCPDARLLTKWKNGKASVDEIDLLEKSAMALWQTLPQMTISDIMDLWAKAYRAHATTLKEKAIEGVDLHAELERFVRDEMSEP